jgi:hypothetical protein
MGSSINSRAVGQPAGPTFVVRHTLIAVRDSAFPKQGDFVMTALGYLARAIRFFVARVPMAAAFLVWASLASVTAAGTIVFDGDATFSQNLSVLTGDSQIARLPGNFPPPYPSLSSIGNSNTDLTSGGILYTGGSFSYTSVANDVDTGVVIYWSGQRQFTASGGRYGLEAVLSGSIGEPAEGLVTAISLETSVLSHGNDATLALAKVNNPADGKILSADVLGSAFNYAAGANDTLYQVGKIEISPTEAGQLFTFDFTGYNKSLINSIPEPTSLILLGTATAGLLGHVWRRRRKPAPSGCSAFHPGVG